MARGGGSTMGLPPVAVGGGGIGIVVLVAFVLLQALQRGPSGSTQTPSDLAATAAAVPTRTPARTAASSAT